MLKCGHNYCRECIDRVLNTQKQSFFCPECREEFRERPTLHKNITLRNIVENFVNTQPDPEGSRIFCSHCVDSPVAAVKSCLHCEVSLCDKHLSVHKRSPEHVLSDPTTTLENRKCSIHKKILEYYCTEDSACICVSCCLIGEHKGHQMESLEEASEQKKKKMRNVLQKMATEKEEIEEKVRSLEKHGVKVKTKAAGEREKVTALFKDLIRQLEELEKKILSEISSEREKVTALFKDLIRQLEELEKKILSEISSQEKQLSFSNSDQIQRLEIKKDELSRKIRHIEDLDVVGISYSLHTGLFNLITGVNKGICAEKASDILLDVNTASVKLYIR
uniref:Uncharacterized protein n=1 Tax=Pyxicephalus adspersus TaxID=30357 RepID=A0AAV3AZS2_PYXAD|nr:TPA: hypothetical protein GDO54_006283 [Pyxicephalus adspersus]